MPDIEALAISIVEEIYDYTSGRPGKSVDLDRIAQRLQLSRKPILAEAIRVAEAEDWVVVEDGHSLTLTNEGRRAVTST
jgi:Mn-dependent DtxR family transcriptional regulator